MLERSLGLLADAGAAEVVVVTGYLADRLRDRLEALDRRPPLREVRSEGFQFVSIFLNHPRRRS